MVNTTMLENQRMFAKSKRAGRQKGGERVVL